MPHSLMRPARIRAPSKWSAISALDTATWQLPIFPSTPPYCCCTLGDCVPCFGKPVSSSARMPDRIGTAARNCAQTRASPRRRRSARAGPVVTRAAYRTLRASTSEIDQIRPVDNVVLTALVRPAGFELLAR